MRHLAKQVVRRFGYKIVALPQQEDRQVSEFTEAIAATPGMIGLDQAALLNDLARSANGAIVEIGSYRGRSTVALAYGHSNPVYAIDPHQEFVGVLGGQFGPEDRAEFYRTMLRTGCWSNVRLINLPSVQAAVGWTQPIHLLWIDGDHSYDSVRRDWEAWTPHLVDDALAVFDDCEPPDLGPGRLVEELMSDGWHRVDKRGRVEVLRH
jgi:predicted O-methyltransferase YrrM